MVRSNLEKSIFQHLTTAAKSRANHIETFIEDHKQTLDLVSSGHFFRELLSTNINEPEYKNREKKVTNRLKTILKIYKELDHIELRDRNSRVVVSPHEAFLKSDDYVIMHQKNIRGAFCTGDVFICKIHKTPIIRITAPITFNGANLGFIVAGVSINAFSKITLNRTGLGETGQIYLINKDSYMITPSRFKEDVILKQKIDTANAKNCLGHIDAEEMPLSKMIGIFKDYRGVRVLGTHVYLPDMQWGLLAEIDAKEALAPLRLLKFVFILILLIIPIVAWLTGIVVSRMISNPIHRLHKGSEIIGNGNLDYKVATDSMDEIGQLSRSFDKMTEKLKNTMVSREYVENIIKSMIASLVVVTPEGRIQRVNQATCDLLGFKTEELIEQPIGKIFIEEEEEEELQKLFQGTGLQELIEKGFIKGIERYYLAKDKSKVPVLFSGSVMRDSDGSIQGIICLASDMSELKQAERLIQESEKKYKSIFENAVEGFFQSTPEGCFITVNQAFAKMLHYSSPEELVTNISDIATQYYVNPEDRGKYEQSLKIDGFAKNFEFQARCKDGSHIWVSNSTRAIYNQDKKIIRYEGRVTDITKRKLVEEALKKSEREYRTTLNDLQVGVVVLAADTSILLSNIEATKILGLSYEQMSGKSAVDPYLNFVHEDLTIVKIENYPVSKVFSTKKPIHDYILGVNRPDKNYVIWVSVNADPVFSDDGELEKIIINFVDITAQKRVKEEKKKIESQLQQSQKMESIGTLAGGIAHDFNNILFPIVGHTEMLMEDIPEESPLRDSINEIYNGALRARELVKQILTFSRQERCDVKLMKMQPIIKEALKLLRSTIPTTIEIKKNIQADCGVIKADPTQIHQIIMNLATNAWHAMEETGGVLEVNLKEIKSGVLEVINPEFPPDMTHGTYACLIVSDSGKGMDKEMTMKIFDPFFTTKKNGKGTGMGLSVVHGIVAGMGGIVQVDSEPGSGTSFHIYIPVEKTSFEKPDIKTNEKIQTGSERILLVDDEESVVIVVKRLLERMGYKVTSHTSSIDALKAFRFEPDKFDLIITDMTMPNMTGDKLAEELNIIRPDIPVLLCTGYSEIISEEKAASLGIRGFLLKPVKSKDLSLKIREIMDDS